MTAIMPEQTSIGKAKVEKNNVEKERENRAQKKTGPSGPALPSRRCFGPKQYHKY